MNSLTMLDFLVLLQGRSIRLHSRLLPNYEEWQKTYQTQPRTFSDDIPRSDAWELEALIGTYTILGESLADFGLKRPNSLLDFLDENVGALEELRRGNLHKAHLRPVEDLQAAYLAATS